MKKLGIAIQVVCWAFALWFMLSWAEIATNNLTPGYEYNKYNFFVVFTQDTAEEEPEAANDYEGMCGNPINDRVRMICGFVDSINYDDNIVTFVDEDGEAWIAEVGYAESFDPDGYYLIMFDHQGTADPYDDEIVKVFKEVW